ncbi:ricin-type beta-trefoil lectin domain protein [Kitasatospora sp. NPDC087314]|uniref:ricin-type beta-trefoil lectin domain protein n=1 Tax=Kitasatospora sp. NPDC087314 TaxID=3364068 RepID=UPI00382A5E32
MRPIRLVRLIRPTAALAAAGCVAGLTLAVTAPTAAAATGTGPVTGLAGKCLTDAGGSTADGNPITLSGCDGSASQIWKLATDGSVRVLGKCLDVTGANTAPGTPLQLYSCNGTGAQRWGVAVDGTLVNAKSGNCLDVGGGSAADGARTVIATCTPGSAGQQWQPPATDCPAPTDPGPQRSTAGVATGLLPQAAGGLAPLSWSATGLPAGLSINYSTGTIVGTPTGSGSSTVTLTATDSRGSTGSTTFGWTVNAADTAASWYLDCSAATNGSGTEDAPWNSLGTANARTFQPGDALLLKAGATCNGQLAPQGNGSATAPITIGSYGGSARPTVAGGGLSGATGAAVLLHNQSYWIVQGLEVTNNAATEAWRSGINVVVDDLAEHDGITIRDNLVHDVMGSSDRGADHKGFYLSHGVGADLPVNGGFVKGLTIADNYVRDSHVNGIGLYGNQDNGGDNNNAVHNRFVHITGNTIERNTSDGIVICVSDSPLVEYNVSDLAGTNAVNPQNIAGIWGWADDSPTFQHNEVSNLVVHTNDSEAWDCDGYMTGVCSYQHNYDHNNYGGILLNCLACGGGYNASIVFRDNVSVDDCRIVSNGGSSAISFLFANNTIDCGGKHSDIGLLADTTVANNVFAGAAAGSTLPTGPAYQHNTYTGFAAPSSDPAPSTVDPRFTAPGSADYGINSVGGYQLGVDSPAYRSGIALSGASATDYWGNATSAATPNRGAYGGPALGAATCTDDSSAAIGYSGGWDSSGSAGCGSGLDHWSNSTGATADFTFTGTELTYYGSQTPDNGIAALSIDGAPAVDVNLYAPVKRLGLPLYTSPVLAAGTHRVTVTVSGRKDPRSTGGYVSLDAFAVR